MIVCHCRGVSDHRIRKAVREGASSRAQVALACGAGRSCGGCAPLIEEILACESHAEAALPTSAPASPAAATS